MDEVDVVIPVRFGVRFLPQAVESVLGQRSARCRVHVIDDGAEESVTEVLGADLASRCQYIGSNPGVAGIGAARNHGASLGTAPLLAFLDCDDLWPADRTAVLGALMERTSADVAFGMVEQFVDGDPAAFRASDRPQRGMLAGGMLLRRDCWQAVGGFDTELPVGEFIDWVSRLRRSGRSEATSDQIVLRRRIHGDNTTLHRAGQRAAYASVIRRHLLARESSR